MAQWGRDDKKVTLGGNTSQPVTSTGAPIGTWSLVKGDRVNRVDAANAHFGDGSAGSRANTDSQMFGNTTAGAFLDGVAVGVFGVDVNEVAASPDKGVAHAGWNVRREGTGGRAGRVQYETLVAMRTLGAQTAVLAANANPKDASDDSTLPDYTLTLTTQPANVSANAANNDSKTFSVGATTTPSGGTPTYLWQYSTTNATSGFVTTVAVSGFSGQTSNTLTANSNTLAANVWVRAVVAVTGGANVTSSVAKLTVV